nr:hypothetical protein GCM10017745_46890 [Saccharothrix mutabilis subsp. capreolus]
MATEMTLNVHAYIAYEDGRMAILDPLEVGRDLAGPEQWRTLVWGSPEVRTLGTRFFPVSTAKTCTSATKN